MEVVVADDQLSLAIGKKGQNVRLTSKLTGWKIDIKSESKMEKIAGEVLEIFRGLPNIGDVGSRILYNEGYRTLRDLAEADPEEVAKVLGYEKEKASKIVEIASQMTQEKEPKESIPETPPVAEGLVLAPVEKMEGVGEKLAEILKSHGFQSIKDIAESDIEKLSRLQGIGVKRAEKLIQSAKQLVEIKNQ